MAILEDRPGIKVYVRIGDAECAEYDDPDIEGEQTSCPTSSKYIESVDDAEFGVRFEVTPDYKWDYKNHDLVFYCYLDGKYFGGLVTKRSSDNAPFHTKDDLSEQISRTETGNWVSRKAKFSAVKIGKQMPCSSHAAYSANSPMKWMIIQRLALNKISRWQAILDLSPSRSIAPYNEVVTTRYMIRISKHNHP